MSILDVESRREYEVGAVQWVASRYERHDGHGCDDSCEARGLEECFGEITRGFPNRGLAVAFARRNPGIWGGTVQRQEFRLLDGSWPAVGCWEPTEEAEEIDCEEGGAS